MNRKETWRSRSVLPAALTLLLAGGAALADAYDDIVKYDWEKGRGVPAAVEADVRKADTPAARQAVEAKLLKALADTEATYECKQFVCRMLRSAGSPACVPALAKLLPDANLSHMARFALQHLPAPQATDALLEALGKVDGKLRIGVVGSLGERRDPKAVPALAKLLAEGDAELVRAAVAALGRIAAPEAAEALAAAKVPADLRAARDDAQLLCADRMLADGEATAAAGAYRKLFDKGNPKMIRIAALRGIALSEKEKAAKDLLALMQDEDVDLRRAAGKFIMEMPGPAATKAFAGALASMPRDGQIALIDALTERGDRAAAPEVTRLAEGADEAVRLAAIKALAVLGDAASVPMLAKMVAAGGPAGQAATDSLNRLKGPGVSEAMGKLLDSQDAGFRGAILTVLAARADRTMIPAMLKGAGDRDENVRKAAIGGLVAVAGPGEMPAIVEAILATKDAADRAGLERALSAAALRADDPETRARPIAAGLAKADDAAKVLLVSVLGRLGGRNALAAVRAQLGAAGAEVATEAARALAGWPDPSPAGDLLNLIKTTKDPTHKVLAFRGYVRMAGMPGAGDATAMYRQAMALAADPAEKKSVLAGLAGARSADALRLVEPLLADDALKAEAEAACVQIAGNARDGAPDEARAALKKLIAGTKNDGLRQRAQEILAEMDKYSGYVTSWLGSGPYTADSPFDTAYPPEQKGASGVRWKVLTDGIAPQAIDLQKAIGGGDNRAAYMKTSVWSPSDQDVRLEIGSDDGVKVWINGKLVHSNNASRPCQPGEDKAKAHLVNGWNAVLVKVAQGGGDWAFSVRICKPDGGALEGMRVSVEGK